MLDLQEGGGGPWPVHVLFLGPSIDRFFQKKNLVFSLENWLLLRAALKYH